MVRDGGALYQAHIDPGKIQKCLQIISIQDSFEYTVRSFAIFEEEEDADDSEVSTLNTRTRRRTLIGAEKSSTVNIYGSYHTDKS